MPTNRRPAARGRRFRLSPEAVERWRQIRPAGISFGANGCGAGFEDEILARCFNEGVLIAQGEAPMRELFAALEVAVGQPTPA